MTGDLIAALTRTDVPAGVVRAKVILQAGESLAYRAAEWHGALVLLTHGTIRLVSSDEARVCFGTGAILALQGRALRCIENPGTDAAVLVTLTRGQPGARPQCW